MARKDGVGVGQAEMAHDDLTEHVAEIGGDLEVASFESLLRGEAGPPSVHLAPVDVGAYHQHGVPVSVIGSAIPIFSHGTAKLRHRQHQHVLHAVCTIRRECGNPAGEIVETVGEKPGGGPFVDVMIPTAGFGKGNLETDVCLDELRNLLGRQKCVEARFISVSS